MKSEFKLGDRFCLKYTRDMFPLEICDIKYEHHEPVYSLRPIRPFNADITVILGESALIELYSKIKRSSC